MDKGTATDIRDLLPEPVVGPYVTELLRSLCERHSRGANILKLLAYADFYGNKNRAIYEPLEDKILPANNGLLRIEDFEHIRSKGCRKCELVIRGILYRCRTCESFDVCANCYLTDGKYAHKWQMGHEFFRIPSDEWVGRLHCK
jgi:hypothetical protein